MAKKCSSTIGPVADLRMAPPTARGALRPRLAMVSSPMAIAASLIMLITGCATSGKRDAYSAEKTEALAGAVVAGFGGQFAPSTWTTENSNAKEITISTAKAPAEVSFSMTNAAADSPRAALAHLAPLSGYVTFTYSYQGTGYVPFGYSVNSRFFPINAAGTTAASGQATFRVRTGDLFKIQFGQKGSSGSTGPAKLKISNFAYIPYPQKNGWSSGYTNLFAPATWQSSPDSTGTIQTTFNSSTLQFTAGTNFPWCCSANAAASHVMLVPGAITFDFSFTNQSNLTVPQIAYSINGNQTVYANNGPEINSQTGTVGFPVNAGDVVQLSLAVTLPQMNPNGLVQLTISNFRFVPQPFQSPTIYPGTNGFSGTFAPSSWTQSATGGATATFSGSQSVVLNGNPNGINDQVIVSNKVASGGGIIFSYLYNNPSFKSVNCPATYILNGKTVTLTPSLLPDPGNGLLSGTLAIPVKSGDVIGFGLGNGVQYGCVSPYGSPISFTISGFSDTVNIGNIPGTVGFSGAYAPSAWTQTALPTGSSLINMSGAPASIQLSNAPTSPNSYASISASATKSGAVVFHYDYENPTGDPASCPATYFINSQTYTISPTSFPTGNDGTSGLLSFNLKKGDKFGFTLGSGGSSSCDGGGSEMPPITLEISEFTLTE